MMYYGSCAMNSFADISDAPPAEWCLTTLHTLSNKYEHLSDSRKVNPPFAEAVLNSFKSKLLNVISTPTYYDSGDASEDETEWPLGSDSATTAYDGASNYLTITPSSIIEASANGCYDKESDDADDELATGLLSPSPSPTGNGDAGSYLGADDFNATLGGMPDNSDICLTGDDAVVLPPSIEEALRRFLANSSNQVLSDTFTTFADAESSADVAATADDSEGDKDDVDHVRDAQIYTEDLLSPEDPSSPEEPLEFLATADSVDIFVKDYSANGSWETVQPSLSAEDDALLPPCKRKRGPNSELLEEAEQNAASIRSTQLPRTKLLPLSPRKRSRSVSCNDAAAVPTAKTSDVASAAIIEAAVAAVTASTAATTPVETSSVTA
ncbi:hypothetical protein LPJ53_005063 [Coemansia erecta]|uniref:Uncharacterized protein n=1 Tax=Coemansia erecta TaxID=147472 RepID=A0A9W7XT66_9FUNG|nr:hypothetical protein LPJ53_005063 [Coemansia erecta]